MKKLLVVSPSAAAGKTVWIVGLVRALREANVRVGVLKPVSEDETGHKMPDGYISTSAMHLAAAAGLPPSGIINPILLHPTHPHRTAVFLFGRWLGEVSRCGRDMPVLDELGVDTCIQLEYACMSACDHFASSVDLLVIEGAGGAIDLALLGATDLVNIGMAQAANGIIIVARASSGGGLASIAGTVDLFPLALRNRLIGFAFNDVRTRFTELCTASHRFSEEKGVPFLGAMPWIEWFEGRPRYAPFTTASENDYSVLAKALRSNIDIAKIMAEL